MKYFFLLILIFWVNHVFSQAPYCSVDDRIPVEGVDSILPSYTLKNYLNTDYSSMFYCAEYFNEDKGGSYTLNYTDEGGSGMDGYPNVSVGGSMLNGQWQPGNNPEVLMPVRLIDIHEDMMFEWITSQKEAWDDNDKWMASINFIFDNYGTEWSKPLNVNRDYDLVVMHTNHNFKSDFNDLEEPSNNRIWYYARESNGEIKHYILSINGIDYTYAVRYKFFVGTETKDNKVHVKFIPHNITVLPGKVVVNVKDIIKASKDFIAYTNMPVAYQELANRNVAVDTAWLKGINAGYEVYTGQSELNIDKFKVGVNLISSQPSIKESIQHKMWPNPTHGGFVIELNDANQEHSIEVYNNIGMLVYRMNTINNKQVYVKFSGPTGIYIVRCQSNSRVQSFRLIKH